MSDDEWRRIFVECRRFPRRSVSQLLRAAALLYAILRIRQAPEKLIRPIHSGWSDAAVIYGRDHKLAKNDVKLHCHREVTILPRDDRGFLPLITHRVVRKFEYV